MSRRQLLTAAQIGSLMALSACGGGGGGGVSSVSAAPAAVSGPVSVVSQTIVNREALAPTVATTAGTYDTIALLVDQSFDQTGSPGAKVPQDLANSSIRITSRPASHGFTLNANLPDGAVDKTFVGSSDAALHSRVATNEYYADFGYRIDFVYNYSDGTKSDVRSQDIVQFVANAATAQTSATTTQTSEFFTRTGQRYVSYGEWLVEDFATDDAGRRQTRSRTAEIIYGLRTEPSDIPISGSASYADADGYLHLNADFGGRTIAADLNYPAKVITSPAYEGGADLKQAIVGIKASGSAPIQLTGDFLIPLTGTSITPDPDGKRPDIISPVDGSFKGAFFGPQATEAAGFAEITGAGGGDGIWWGTPFLLKRQ